MLKLIWDNLLWLQILSDDLICCQKTTISYFQYWTAHGNSWSQVVTTGHNMITSQFLGPKDHVSTIIISAGALVNHSLIPVANSSYNTHTNIWTIDTH